MCVEVITSFKASLTQAVLKYLNRQVIVHPVIQITKKGEITAVVFSLK